MVKITLTNDGAIPHSVDFHAARVAPDKAFTDVMPGKSVSYTFRANDAGVFMYHCGTKPVLMHIANGMYGAIVVEPKAGVLPKADKDYVLVASEWYLNSDGLKSPAQFDMDEGARADARLDDLQRLLRPVREASADRQAGRARPLLGRRRRPVDRHRLPHRRDGAQHAPTRSPT